MKSCEEDAFGRISPPSGWLESAWRERPSTLVPARLAANSGGRNPGFFSAPPPPPNPPTQFEGKVGAC